MSSVHPVLAMFLLTASSPALAQADPARIIDEGLNRSQVMLTASDQDPDKL